jgi:hypothetical protein
MISYDSSPQALPTIKCFRIPVPRYVVLDGGGVLIDHLVDTFIA